MKIFLKDCQFVWFFSGTEDTLSTVAALHFPVWIVSMTHRFHNYILYWCYIVNLIVVSFFLSIDGSIFAFATHLWRSISSALEFLPAESMVPSLTQATPLKTLVKVGGVCEKAMHCSSWVGRGHEECGANVSRAMLGRETPLSPTATPSARSGWRRRGVTAPAALHGPTTQAQPEEGLLASHSQHYMLTHQNLSAFRDGHCHTVLGCCLSGLMCNEKTFLKFEILYLKIKTVDWITLHL